MPHPSHTPSYPKARLTSEYDHLLWYQRRLCGLCLKPKPSRQRLVLHHPTPNTVGLLCRRCLKDLRRWRQAIPPFASLRAQLGHTWIQRADVWLGRTPYDPRALPPPFQPPRISYRQVPAVLHPPPSRKSC